MATKVILTERIKTRYPYWSSQPTVFPRGNITGTLTAFFFPTRRRVYLYDRLSGVLIASAFSKADGTWEIKDLPLVDVYNIIARDWADVWDDLISSRVQTGDEANLNFSYPAVFVEPGSLRIGGDAPNGLILVDGEPASRIVDIFTRDTINEAPELIHVRRTASAIDGTYSFTGLSDRPEGYDVCIRGIIANGERDVWVPGVHPG